VAIYDKPLSTLVDAWRAFLRQRTKSPEGSAERIRLDGIFNQGESLIEQLLASDQDGEKLLLCGRALKLLAEWNPFEFERKGRKKHVTKNC
jgi:hypothetical protein